MDYQTSLYALMRQSLFSPPLNYLPQHSEKKGNAECCCPSQAKTQVQPSDENL